MYSRPGSSATLATTTLREKVEQPVLEAEYFKALRYAQSIPSKKGRYPLIQGLVYPDAPVLLSRDREGDPHLTLSDNVATAVRTVQYLTKPTGGKILFPAAEPALPDAKMVSRFLAKAGLEALALRFLPYAGGHNYIANEPQLDPVRDYGRRGSMVEVWPYHARRIYSANHAFAGDRKWEQVLFEFDFLYTQASELYFVLAILGVEFALNMGGATVEGYQAWCAANSGRSPLYPSGVPADLADPR